MGKPTVLDVVYSELGRCPDEGLVITGGDSTGSIGGLPSSSRGGGTSIFGGSDGRSIFSIDRSSVFSGISKIASVFSQQSSIGGDGIDGPRRLRATHSFLEEHSGETGDSEEDEDDDDSDASSVATIGAAPVKPVVLADYQPRPRKSAHFLHSLSNDRNKITLVLESIGAKDKPIYVQGICTDVKGKVLVRLQEDDEQVKVILKGTTRAGVPQGIGSGIGSLAVTEDEFFSSSQVLWSRKGSEPRPSAAGDLREWLFKLPIPGQTLISKANPKPAQLPPTFTLNAAKGDVAPGTVALASVQYFIKVIVTKANLMRSKERLIAPIVYLSQNPQLDWLSQERRRAIADNMPIAGPQRDWHAHTETIVFEKALFKTAKTAYKLELLVPSPIRFARQEIMPVEVNVTSTDVTALDHLTAENVEVLLIQRCVAKVGQTHGRKENTLDKAHLAYSDSAVSNGGGEFTRSFSGSLNLRTANVVSFNLDAMHLQYRIMVGLTIPGQLTAWTHLVIGIDNIPSLYRV